MIPPITLVTPSGFLVTGGGAVTEVLVVPEVVDPVGTDAFIEYEGVPCDLLYFSLINSADLPPCP